MLQAILASFWLPEVASKNAAAYDPLFYFILAVNIIFSSLIMAMLIFFIFKYRHKEGRPHNPTAGHSTALELTWTILPTLLVLIIFYYGFRGYLHANTVPPNADHVQANGAMWKWTFTYDTGLTDDELHLVVDRPVDMALNSADVIHDLDIPAFRMKKDVVPGRFNREWFEPDKTGTYDVYCAMYCGTGHSIMLAKCVVESQADFDHWMADKMIWETKVSLIDRGAKLYTMMGCAQCHTLDGGRSTGPTWKDLYGFDVPLVGGGHVMADDAYIKESILQPSAKIVATFEDKMPQDFGAKLKPNDVTALTWFIRSLSSKGGDLTMGKSVNVVKHGGDGTVSGGPTTAPSGDAATQPAPK